MATLVGVRLASLHVLEGLAVHVRDQVDVREALASVSAQVMAVLVVVVQGSAVDHTVPAMAPMRPQMARHVTPRR